MTEHDLLDNTSEPLNVEFAAGLFGFPECRRFRLSRTTHNGFYWLESAENPALGFVLADPFVFFENYAVDVGEGEAAALAAAHATELAVLVTATLPREPGGACTVNLQGPLLINATNGRARQIVLNQPGLELRAPLPPLVAAA
jgi:flagellar assembly factor FliW